MNDREEMAQRLRKARQDAGFASAAAAADARGWTASTLTSHENGTRGYGVDEAKKYGRAFRVNPGWLLALDKIQPQEVELLSSETLQTESLKVTTSVQAGMWRETIDWPSDEWYSIDVGPNPYPGTERFAVRCDGYSMDKVIPPGSNLECISVAFGRIEPQPGDLVIAERRRHDLVEMTCKRLDRDDNGFVLRCESTKPEFADNVLRVGKPDRDGGTDDETRIIGLVVNAQQRHFSRR